MRTPRSQRSLRPDADTGVFWQQAAANLKAGRVRLVFVADEIPRELAASSSLNEQMTAEVIAIEVKQYVGRRGPHARAASDRPDRGRADAQATAREAPMG